MVLQHVLYLHLYIPFLAGKWLDYTLQSRGFTTRTVPTLIYSIPSRQVARLYASKSWFYNTYCPYTYVPFLAGKWLDYTLQSRGFTTRTVPTLIYSIPSRQVARLTDTLCSKLIFQFLKQLLHFRELTGTKIVSISIWQLLKTFLQLF